MNVGLGPHLRAGRLGFGWVSSIEAFVRIVELTPKVFRFDVVAPDSIPKTASKDERHFVWWRDGESEKQEAMHAEIEEVCREALGPIRLRHGAFSFTVGDDGKRKVA